MPSQASLLLRPAEAGWPVNWRELFGYSGTIVTFRIGAIQLLHIVVTCSVLVISTPHLGGELSRTLSVGGSHLVRVQLLSQHPSWVNYVPSFAIT